MFFGKGEILDQYRLRNRLIVIMCLFIPGFFIGIVSPTALKQAWTTKRWQKTHAIVDQSFVGPVHLENLLFHRPAFGPPPAFTPKVMYHFTVNGIRYEGSQIEVPPLEESFERATADVNSYSTGQIIEIYYDPLSPGTCAIRKPDRGLLHLLLGCLFGFPIFLLMLSMITKACEKHPRKYQT